MSEKDSVCESECVCVCEQECVSYVCACEYVKDMEIKIAFDCIDKCVGGKRLR